MSVFTAILPGMKQILPRLLILSALGLALSTRAETAKLVVYGRTHGSYNYVDDPDSPQYRGESFVIAEGHKDPGPGDPASHDLDAVSFTAISGALSESLFRRAFTAPSDPNSADLIVVVHRGRTAPVARAARGSEAMSSSGPPAPLPTGPTGAFGIGSSAGSSPTTVNDVTDSSAIVKAARILGFYPRYAELHQNRASVVDQSRYRELLGELTQERYYLVIAAYDAREMRNSGRQVLLWETRLSFLAEKKSFADRYDDMIAAGSAYFAANTPRTLARKFVRIK
ncbi:MAG: hypothetical protein SynsKO_16020 [Synoicihabitans sp.]